MSSALSPDPASPAKAFIERWKNSSAQTLTTKERKIPQDGYGWRADISEEDILVDLNRPRATKEATGTIPTATLTNPLPQSPHRLPHRHPRHPPCPRAKPTRKRVGIRSRGVKTEQYELWTGSLRQALQFNINFARTFYPLRFESAA